MFYLCHGILNDDDKYDWEMHYLSELSLSEISNLDSVPGYINEISDLSNLYGDLLLSDFSDDMFNFEDIDLDKDGCYVITEEVEEEDMYELIEKLQETICRNIEYC